MTPLLTVGVNLSYLRPGRVGGSETYVRELLSHMADRDDIRLVLFGSQPVLDTFAGIDSRVTSVPLPGKSFSALSRVLNEQLMLRSSLRGTAIDVLFSPANFGVVTASGVPQVVTVHDLQHVALRQNFSRVKRMVRSTLFNLTFRRSAAIISVSRATQADILSTFDLKGVPVVTVHEGVSPNLKRTPKQVTKTLSRYGLGGQYVYYPAMLAPHKNHMFLLEIFHSVLASRPDLTLVLTGKETPLWSALLNEIHRRHLGRSVRYLGYVERDEVFDLMSGASSVLYPSRFEGFGLPVLEAMSCGAPVVAARQSSIPEIAGEAALLVPLDAKADWVSAILRVLGPDVAGELVKKGEANVSRFSWDRCAEETLDVFRMAMRREAGSNA